MQISQFQRFKNYVNSLPVGATYTTNDLYENVGRYESKTWWKSVNKQRMYLTSTYQTYLKRLGALQNVKRGTWKVLHRIPEWFFSRHANQLLGYLDSDSKYSEFIQAGMPASLADKHCVPQFQRYNPFNKDSVSIDFELLKTLYEQANGFTKQKIRSAYPDRFRELFRFGTDYVTDCMNRISDPFFIGNAMVPDELRFKSLVVNEKVYKLVVEDRVNEIGGETIKVIYFVKK